MIGDRDLRIKRDLNSTPWLTDIIWAAARSGRSSTAYFVAERDRRSKTTTCRSCRPACRRSTSSTSSTRLAHRRRHARRGQRAEPAGRRRRAARRAARRSRHGSRDSSRRRQHLLQRARQETADTSTAGLANVTGSGSALPSRRDQASGPGSRRSRRGSPVRPDRPPSPGRPGSALPEVPTGGAAFRRPSIPGTAPATFDQSSAFSRDFARPNIAPAAPSACWGVDPSSLASAPTSSGLAVPGAAPGVWPGCATSGSDSTASARTAMREALPSCLPPLPASRDRFLTGCRGAPRMRDCRERLETAPSVNSSRPTTSYTAANDSATRSEACRSTNRSGCGSAR